MAVAADPLLQTTTRSGRRITQLDYSSLLGRRGGGSGEGAAGAPAANAANTWFAKLDDMPRLTRVVMIASKVMVHIKINGKWSWWRAHVQRVIKKRGRGETGGQLTVLFDSYLHDEEADVPDTVDLGDCVVAPADCPARVMRGG